MLQFILDHKAEILAFLLAVSEFLGIWQGVASNSIYQLIVAGLKKIKDIVIPPAA